MHSTNERIVSHKPKSLTYAQTASLPLASITAWEGLFDRLDISDKEEGSILIFGGAGGVGSMAIQLLKAKTKLKVIATASSPESREWCKKMGADIVIDRNMVDELKSAGIPEVDYVFGLTGTEEYKAIYPSIIKPKGKLCLIDDPQSLDIVNFKRRSISVH